MRTLKDKIATDLKERGGVSLSSADVAAFKPEDKKDIGAPPTGPVTTTVPSDANSDPILNEAERGDASRALSSKAVEIGGNNKLMPDNLRDKVEVTPGEREAFLSAIITGQRYEQPFSLYGGRVTGKFVCRSNDESNAILTRMVQEVRENKITTQVEYSARMRHILLTAQVAQLNGATLGPLTAPLFRKILGADKCEEPAWLNQVTYWEQQSAALSSAIYEALRLFERKYWTMVDNATDQNFWQPVAST